MFIYIDLSKLTSLDKVWSWTVKQHILHEFQHEYLHTAPSGP